MVDPKVSPRVEGDRRVWQRRSPSQLLPEPVEVISQQRSPLNIAVDQAPGYSFSTTIKCAQVSEARQSKQFRRAVQPRRNQDVVVRKMCVMLDTEKSAKQPQERIVNVSLGSLLCKSP